eukprot:SAG22_NODE_1091_length_5589_cov_3.691439_2_plen_380_part_00
MPENERVPKACTNSPGFWPLHSVGGARCQPVRTRKDASTNSRTQEAPALRSALLVAGGIGIGEETSKPRPAASLSLPFSLVGRGELTPLRICLRTSLPKRTDVMTPLAPLVSSRRRTHTENRERGRERERERDERNETRREWSSGSGSRGSTTALARRTVGLDRHAVDDGLGVERVVRDEAGREERVSAVHPEAAVELGQKERRRRRQAVLGGRGLDNVGRARDCTDEIVSPVAERALVGPRVSRVKVARDKVRRRLGSHRARDELVEPRELGRGRPCTRQSVGQPVGRSAGAASAQGSCAEESLVLTYRRPGARGLRPLARSRCWRRAWCTWSGSRSPGRSSQCLGTRRSSSARSIPGMDAGAARHHWRNGMAAGSDC